jgi:hypothetical protein
MWIVFESWPTTKPSLIASRTFILIM